MDWATTFSSFSPYENSQEPFTSMPTGGQVDFSYCQMHLSYYQWKKAEKASLLLHLPFVVQTLAFLLDPDP